MESGEVEDAAENKKEAVYELDHDKAALIDAVKRLPAKYRVVIHLFYYEELTVEEIGRITKAKASTVRTRLTRARRQLGSLLKAPLAHNGGGSRK